MNSTSLRFQCTQVRLDNWTLIKVTGVDRETFFQGQVTSDLSLLKNQQGHISARLNRVGKLQSFFFLMKHSEFLQILVPNELVEIVLDDFRKYIIMEDVELEVSQVKPWIIFNPFLIENEFSEEFCDFNFYGLNARLNYSPIENVEFSDLTELESIRILNGWPIWKKDISEKDFINETFLNQIAISYKKGCFLGQETAAKIENNRGSSFFPMLLKLKNTTEYSEIIGKDFQCDGRKAGNIHYQVGCYFQASLYRDFRVVGKSLVIEIDNILVDVIVEELPLFKSSNRGEMAIELYHLAVDMFQENNIEIAKSYLKTSIQFDPSYSDPYESLGVILGREGNLTEALEWMDKLLVVNPQSVMAHTNKSLFLMKLGRIEEAEAEKSLATVKSFAYHGTEAKLKKQLEEEKIKQEVELSRREKMFLQVLEIDPDDSIALFGMADIYYYRKQFQDGSEYLKKVITTNPNYSTAYLLLGKTYEALNDKGNAIAAYQAGISIASKQGDMMPANEMQSRLNQLVVIS